jgi:hypothetical protein
MPIALAERGGITMKSRLLALAAVALAAPAPGAHASTVRVEGDAATLVERAGVTGTAGPVVKDGDPSHACPGTSAAGALEQATDGDWTGPWFAGLGLSVSTIRGETHLFGSGSYWSVFVNGVPADQGLCGLTPKAGDELLLAPVPETGAVPRPLRLSAPATATAGCPFLVRVTADVNVPVAGATVAGATTAADGTGSVTLSASGALKATRAGDVRSAAVPVGVTSGACGPPAPPPPLAATPPATVRDRTAPRAGITSIRDGARFAKGHGPRTLAGRARDASGLTAVRVRLKRNRAGVCSGWSASRERFVRIARCGTHRFGRWFSVGATTRWSYLLPARLGLGRYVLDVQARDRAGNATLIDRGRTRVVFHVR